MAENIINIIKKSLEKIRPSLQADGGDIEYMDFDKKNGVLKVRLKGMCAHCPMSAITLQQGVEVEIKKEAPAVKEVMAV
ncbi:hypothetical protein CO115_01190 [Candidatus Falkowbacteria bacterium CG_4_9_14_3_um_filter_36_9]|uniref:NIF system FeS cluster assembly NifU C-terminal domain-containing protein n=1 Tax=Candidatus Falkowbacteria bacterium CG02_land_8_20_14_3_00_36_14 TaxID=1974560 RepID=A0A2M7DKF1_9BACT|nr:MAG: hypothetical protein COS18_05525 [Candidatus Falkowbacteria bacterium CG02_land_8_20_14_3_00_36_14]PIX11803.1 MAG: hypothetical protein COZ73_01770 [Candidatus Falkowbacteria bacterium CG_4_8_14_3_um_filter_36_11]PJA10932.1 MAG: hypothetical protein COX67_02445 [Candidatus Falkowbacteria bacterium CG_4_10_14_0_2_um_filter_36_22]PJB20489.1 MAG: hypothetical protein CO115_01190 [Candidatus Falkowbacteria bacterium CG_4_9_14_3_um_filter_36_9]